jgi:hypothetical protein
MSRPFTWDLNDECKLIGLWCDKRNLSSAEIAKHFDGRYSARAIRAKARAQSPTTQGRIYPYCWPSCCSQGTDYRIYPPNIASTIAGEAKSMTEVRATYGQSETTLKIAVSRQLKYNNVAPVRIEKILKEIDDAPDYDAKVEIAQQHITVEGGE